MKEAKLSANKYNFREAYKRYRLRHSHSFCMLTIKLVSSLHFQVNLLKCLCYNIIQQEQAG